MSATMHTPGPWRLAGEEMSFFKICGPLGKRYEIASVLESLWDDCTQGEAKETLANARLIVHSPELLSFARDIHNSAILLPDSVRADLRALLAKIDGEGA